MDANGSVKEVQDKTDYTRASIDALNSNTDIVDKLRASFQLQARLYAPQEIPADLLHANDGSTTESRSLHAETTNMATQCDGFDLKEFKSKPSRL